MKNLIACLLLIFCFTYNSAQTTSNKKTTKTSEKVIVKNKIPAGVKLKKDGTPDKRYKSAKMLKKDGTPDKRFKENKK